MVEENYSIGILTFVFLLTYFFISSDSLRFSNFHPLLIYAFFAMVVTLANMRQEWKVLNGYSLGGYVYALPKYFFSSSIIWYWSNYFLLLGFENFSPRINSPFFFETKRKGVFIFIFLLGVLIIYSSRFYPISLPGAIGNFFYLLPLFFIFFFSRIGYAKDLNLLINFGYFLMVFSTFLSLLYGFLRFEFIISALVFGLGAYTGRRKLTIFLGIRYLPLLLLGSFFIITFDYFGNNRSQLSYGIERFSQLQTGISQQTMDAQPSNFTALDRMSVISQLSNVVDLYENNSKDYFKETIILLFTSLIPRFLWPEKPKIALGVWFALEIGQALKTETWYNNSINMTIPGHLFLGFGWVGMLLGSYLLGYLIKRFWLYADFMNPNNLLGSMWGGYLMYLAIQGFGADLQIFITLFAIFLLFQVINFIIRSLYAYSLHRSGVER